jgi:hypothetical protein
VPASQASAASGSRARDLVAGFFGDRGDLLALAKSKLVGKFDMEASQRRGCCVAKYATLRAARSDPSLRNERLFGMTSGLGGG